MKFKKAVTFGKHIHDLFRKRWNVDAQSLPQYTSK